MKRKNTTLPTVAPPASRPRRWRTAESRAAILKRIVSVVFSILALAGLVLTLWSPSWPRGVSAPASPVDDVRCAGDNREASSYIVRHWDGPDIGVSGKVILASSVSYYLDEFPDTYLLEDFKEFAVIDFAERTWTEYLCPEYKVSVRIGSVAFTPRGDILATAYDKRAIYLFPGAELNAPPVVYNLPDKDTRLRDNLYAIPDATGDKIWVVRPTDYETTVNLYSADSGILNTMEMTGRYQPAGILSNGIVMRGRDGIIMLAEDGAVTRLFNCPDRDDCPDVVATYDHDVALLEESRTTTNPSGAFFGIFTQDEFGDYGPITRVAFGDLFVIDVETGNRYEITKPVSGSWYGDPTLFEQADVRINRSYEFLMEVETDKGPGWREWSQYIIDIRDQSHRFLRKGTGVSSYQPRIFQTSDHQHFLFSDYNRTLHKMDRESGKRITLLNLPERLDGFYVYDVL